jgi:hypothetical protein
MTQEEFIKDLKEKRYSHKIEGDKIVVTREGDVHLGSLTSLPPDVEFRNEGYVYLDRLTSLPPGAAFKNEGHVNLRSLISIPPDVEFKNVGNINLDSITSLPPGVEFKHRGNVYFKSLMGGRFSDWRGDIEGIDSKRLLNKMISIGLFDTK